MKQPTKRSTGRSTPSKSNRRNLRVSAELQLALAFLQADTGLDATAIFRIAVMDMAKLRGYRISEAGIPPKEKSSTR